MRADFDLRLALLEHPLCGGKPRARERLGPADVRPALLGGFHAGDGAFFDHLALEFSDGTQHVIQQPPGSRRRIEPLAERPA